MTIVKITDEWFKLIIILIIHRIKLCQIKHEFDTNI